MKNQVLMGITISNSILCKLLYQVYLTNVKRMINFVSFGKIFTKKNLSIDFFIKIVNVTVHMVLIHNSLIN